MGVLQYLPTYSKIWKTTYYGEQLICWRVFKNYSTQSRYDIIKTIPISNKTVQRFIDEMSWYWKFEELSANDTLDESTLADNEALILAYVSFVMDQEIQELLFDSRD